MSKVAIIIPTYNESDNIKKLVKKINDYISNAVIFIIDDSPSSEISKLINVNKNNINYFYRKNKRGRGSAVLFGMKKVLKDKRVKLIIEMDADFSHDPRELRNKIKYFKKKNLDMLIASRYLAKSKILNWTLSRRIFSTLSNILARFFLKIQITDFTNGFRFYSIRSAKIILKKCGNIGDGFIILSEIIVVIKNSNFKIEELSTTFVNRTRGESSVNLRLIIQSLLGLIKLTFIKHKL